MVNIWVTDMRDIEITDPEDIALLQHSEGMSVGGRLILPSGLDIHSPPMGYRWVVHTSPSLVLKCERIPDELEQI